MKAQNLLDKYTASLEQEAKSTVELKAENVKLHGKVSELQKTITELKDREETLQYTTGIQADEITRLNNVPTEQ